MPERRIRGRSPAADSSGSSGILPPRAAGSWRTPLVPLLLAVFLFTPSTAASALGFRHPAWSLETPWGRIEVAGAASGFVFAQDHPQGVPGTLGGRSTGVSLTNGLVMLSRNKGLLRFRLDAGAYDFPTLGAALASARSTTEEFGALPIADLEVAPSPDFSVEIGKLPTLIGAENVFTFQNFNIERGLLWNVEPVISRGVQLNSRLGPVRASVSWNDGYSSNRYDWLDGDLVWSPAEDESVEFYAGGNLGKPGGEVDAATGASITDGADDSRIYGLIYTWNRGPWTLEPYVQFMTVPRQPTLGLQHGFTNRGGAILARYRFGKRFSLAARVEYLAVGGRPGFGESAAAEGVTSFPEDSHAWSFTLTPTYRQGGFFLRGELSDVTATTPSGLGSSGPDSTQLRSLIEGGVLF